MNEEDLFAFWDEGTSTVAKIMKEFWKSLLN